MSRPKRLDLTMDKRDRITAVLDEVAREMGEHPEDVKASDERAPEGEPGPCAPGPEGHGRAADADRGRRARREHERQGDVAAARADPVRRRHLGEQGRDPGGDHHGQAGLPAVGRAVGSVWAGRRR